MTTNTFDDPQTTAALKSERVDSKCWTCNGPMVFRYNLTMYTVERIAQCLLCGREGPR